MIERASRLTSSHPYYIAIIGYDISSSSTSSNSSNSSGSSSNNSSSKWSLIASLLPRTSLIAGVVILYQTCSLALY